MVLDSDTTTQAAGFGTMALVSGTTQNRIWQRTVTIPATASPGSWTVTIYPLADTLGNQETGLHQHPSKLMVTGRDATAPDAPTAVRATRGNGSAAVSWSAPADNGWPITSYTVTSSPGGRTVTVPGGQTTGTVTGLTNGTAYTFTVTATNAVGPSAASAPSAPVVPASRPGRVARPAVSVGGRTAIIRWMAPRSGGSPLTGYRVTVNGKARTTAASAHRMVLRNLRPGRYTVKVAGINAVGVGPASVVVQFRIRGS
jgi:predicted phage tail protein